MDLQNIEIPEGINEEFGRLFKKLISESMVMNTAVTPTDALIVEEAVHCLQLAKTYRGIEKDLLEAGEYPKAFNAAASHRSYLRGARTALTALKLTGHDRHQRSRHAVAAAGVKVGTVEDSWDELLSDIRAN